MNTTVTPSRASRYPPAENPFETPDDQAPGYWTYTQGQPASPMAARNGGSGNGDGTMRAVDKALPTSPEGYRDTRDTRGAYASGGGEAGLVPGPASPTDEPLRDERMGVVDKARPKFAKGTSSSSSVAPSRTAAGRFRRALSSDSTGDPYGMNGITAGLEAARIVPVKEKVGSRHADVIDLWDGSGVGKSMWHHSGPYDAAAPSRNVNTSHTKAPMSAFERSRETAAHPHSAPLDSSIPEDIDQIGIAISAPGHQSGFERERKASIGGVGPGAPSPRLPHRGHHSRPATSPGGGLSAAYSTSLPNSGGYFAQGLGPDGEEMDERRQRQRDRENKRKAMQAAWGVDIPEPYEEFGHIATTPTAEEEYGYQLTDDPQPVPIKTGRSPGPRIGLGKSRSGTTPTGNTPPSPAADYFVNGDYPEYAGGGAARGGAGLTRTKSLMQRIKAMRENPNVPVGGGGRSGSPSQSEERALYRTSTGTPTDESGSMSAQQASAPPPKARRNSFLNRRKPTKQGSTPPLPGSPEAQEEILNDLDPNVAPIETANRTGRRDRSVSNSGSNGGFAALVRTRSRQRTRDKSLPPPPAAAPVMPDFADLQRVPTGNDRIRFDGNEKGDVPDQTYGGGDRGLGRKSSIVKKLKDKISR